MSVNQELSERDITQRTSLIVYLRNASNDQFKLRRYGDIVYFSKKLHYLILYVNACARSASSRAWTCPRLTSSSWTTKTRKSS